MTSVKVFFIKPSGRIRRFLRCHEEGTCGARPYHSAMKELDVVRVGPSQYQTLEVGEWPADGPGWPEKCECGFKFTKKAAKQLFFESVYVSADGTETTLRDAPVGACWDAVWFARSHPEWRGADKRSLVVRTPGGEWMIDSRASNCTKPFDSIHKCWVRHGSPEEGTLHVDKDGVTCEAGSGSIQAGAWHGFLHNGVLSEGG